jgi:L-ascorbate metabolism protein UlaG (beta-lactamase superfamily)
MQTLTSSQAAQAARILGAAQVLPVRYNSWKHLTEGAPRTRTRLRRFRVPTLALSPGDHVP